MGAGAAIQGAVSVSISVALALLQPKLIDMAKGEVIKGDENGNETGNAIASGMGAYNARTAQNRGLRPATETAYASYAQETSRIAAEYADVAGRSIDNAYVLDLLRLVQVMEVAVVEHLDSDHRTRGCLCLFRRRQCIGILFDRRRKSFTT